MELCFSVVIYIKAFVFVLFLIDWQLVGEMFVAMLIGVFIDSYIIFFQKEPESFKLFKLM